MKNQKGISVITLIIIVVIVIGIIMLVFVKNQGKEKTNIKWGYMPSSEYYELNLAATTSEVYGSGTLSLKSFNTLGRDVKKAKGKWFKNSNVNFRAKSEKIGSYDIITLTDGENTATFKFDNISDYVEYTFKKGSASGYRITIK